MAQAPADWWHPILDVPSRPAGFEDVAAGMEKVLREARQEATIRAAEMRRAAMAHEKTTLARMKEAENERDLVDAKKEQLGEAIGSVSAGRAAKIDSLQAKLIEGGRIDLVGFAQVCRAEGADDVEVEMILSERQFSGLMGWGLKHFGAPRQNGAEAIEKEGKP